MSSRKTGLGKGLGALIPAVEEGEAPATQGVMEVPVASIAPNPHQPRAPVRDQDLVELAASIEVHGIIQPLVVVKTFDGYQLIAGERRWRAARLAGLPTVPVVVKDVVPREMLELALVENLQRSDLNPLEEAMAYRQLTEEFELTQDQVARQVGKSRVAVSNTLRLLKATRLVQEALLEGKISEGHARALLGLEPPGVQEAALNTVLKQGLNVRQTEELVRHLLGVPEQEQQPAPEVPGQMRALEASFREALGTKVNLARSGKGGRIVIYFYSEEELGALYERIVGGEE
jgi:ParB family chromosome partitioning protein